MDTPKVGDTVRVVLEGKVNDVDRNGLRLEGGAGGYVNFNQGGLKSIEILEPAKPSVKDLPVDSAVRDADTNCVYIRLGFNMPKPWISQWGTRVSDTDLDALNWTLLVPKESA